MKKIVSKILLYFMLLMAFSQPTLAAFTPNKAYNNQTTGSNVNTWGIVLNSNFTQIDSNLGGTLTLSVAGNSDITLSSAQSQNLIYNFTGVLTGNINIIFPAAGGLYFINNQTSGAFTLTIQAGASTSGIIIPQGQSVPIVVDNSTSPPTIDGAIGTQAQYVGVTVGGTANAITIPITTPTNFNLQTGTTIWYFPSSTNTGSTTLNVGGSGAITVKKITPAGLVNLTAGDVTANLPTLDIYNGTNWIELVPVIYTGFTSAVSTAQSVSFANLFTEYVNTAAVTYTIAQTTNLSPYWYVDIDAQGGTATISPNASDVINVNGLTLSAGTSFAIPQGASARLYTDANGNLYIRWMGTRLNAESTLTSASTTNLGSSASNVIDITGTTTITSFGSSASIANPLYFLRFSGALTLTNNNTSLILPGGANITTAAGDTAIGKYEGSGNWRVLSYNPASGKSVIGGGVAAVKRQIITSTGTYTPCTGLLYGDYTIVGGGGGGGGSSSSSLSSGGGGGSGGMAQKIIATATVGSSQTVTIGAAGTAGASSGGTGGTGGTTTMGALLSATGGVGGTGNTGSTGVSGGAGGVGSSGDINLTGNAGGSTKVSTFGTNEEISGYGGSSVLGGAGQEVQASVATAGNNAATNSGSGGSGAVSNSGTGEAGGLGGKGIFIATEYCSQ